MKQFSALFMVVVASAVSANIAQAGRMQNRNGNQQQRIQQGVMSGQLNSQEAQRLENQQKRIRREEMRAHADGQVTPRERARIEHMQDRASRNIYRQKHDGQTGTAPAGNDAPAPTEETGTTN